MLLNTADLVETFVTIDLFQLVNSFTDMMRAPVNAI
jgi:hypothetical protein